MLDNLKSSYLCKKKTLYTLTNKSLSYKILHGYGMHKQTKYFDITVLECVFTRSNTNF